MNLNLLAKEICFHEGKKKQVDIAQVKEVLKVLIYILSEDIHMQDGQKIMGLAKVAYKKAGLIPVPKIGNHKWPASTPKRNGIINHFLEEL